MRKTNTSVNDRRPSAVQGNKVNGHNNHNQTAVRAFDYRTKVSLAYGLNEVTGADFEIGCVLVAQHPAGDVTLLEAHRSKEEGFERKTLKLDWRLREGDALNLICVFRYGTRVFYKTFGGYRLDVGRERTVRVLSGHGKKDQHGAWELMEMDQTFPFIRAAAPGALESLNSLTALDYTTRPDNRCVRWHRSQVECQIIDGLEAAVPMAVPVGTPVKEAREMVAAQANAKAPATAPVFTPKKMLERINPSVVLRVEPSVEASHAVQVWTAEEVAHV